jgi:hypothetical protein
MRLEKREQEQLEERKGLAIKTVIQLIWLVISFGIAYVLVNSLVEAGVFTYAELYATLTLPDSVPQWAIQGTLMLVLVILMQILLFMAFAFASPEGRRRTGEPSLHSRRKDPFDDGG